MTSQLRGKSCTTEGNLQTKCDWLKLIPGLTSYKMADWGGGRKLPTIFNN
jgi:hypothetical protein